MGKILDSASSLPLSNATVTLMLPGDSTFVKFGLSNEKGEFVFKNLQRDTLLLIVSYQGYASTSQTIDLVAQSDTRLNDILLSPKSETLSAVVVQRPPITYKNDTLEFNAGSFKTKANASAEDLLKSLPGVQVDKEGNIRAQGESVQKVYVDGKEFFGFDPRLATRNITAAMIETVQVYDESSEQARFTRVDDGSRQKAINLKLKKEYKVGYFGRASGGGGNRERYDGELSFNRFNEAQRLSILASANNVNKPGFAFGDIMSAAGGFGSIAKGLASSEGGKFSIDGFGGGNSLQVSSSSSNTPTGFGPAGITRSVASGINFTDLWGSKTDFNGSYFFTNPKNKNHSQYIRQNTFPDDSTSIEYRDAANDELSYSHSANLRFEYYADSMNSFLNKTTISIRHSEENLIDSTESYNTSHHLSYKALSSKNYSNNQGEGLGINNTFLFRHRLKRPGRTFTFRWTNNTSTAKGKRLVSSSLDTFDEMLTPITAIQSNFRTRQDITHFDNNFNGTYTEPLGRNKLLEINYTYFNNQSTSDRQGFDFNNSTGKYDLPSTIQTLYFKSRFAGNRFGAQIRRAGKKFDFQAGASLQQSIQAITSAPSKNAEDSSFNRHYTNLLPAANITYRFSNAARLVINYRGRPIFPTIAQLQPAPDLSNPLFIREGNPALKPEYNNTLAINFTSFSITNFHFLSGLINLSQSRNRIANSIDTTGKPGVLRVRPVNVRGYFNALSYLVYGIPLKGKLQGSSLNLSLSGIYNRQNSLLYSKINRTETWMITQGVSTSLDFKKFNMFVNAGLTYNRVAYSANPDLNRNYISQNGSAEFTYTFLNHYQLKTEFDYFKNVDNAGFDPHVLLLNASISRFLFRNDKGEIRIFVFDLLNQNKSFSRRIGENYIEDSRSMVLKPYFIVSFTYRFSKNSQSPSDALPGSFKRQLDQLRITY